MVPVKHCRFAVLFAGLILFALPLPAGCWDGLWRAVLGFVPSMSSAGSKTGEDLPDRGSETEPEEEPGDEGNEGSELDPDG